MILSASLLRILVVCTRWRSLHRAICAFDLQLLRLVYLQQHSSIVPRTQLWLSTASCVRKQHSQNNVASFVLFVITVFGSRQHRFSSSWVLGICILGFASGSCICSFALRSWLTVFQLCSCLAVLRSASWVHGVAPHRILLQLSAVQSSSSSSPTFIALSLYCHLCNRHCLSLAWFRILPSSYPLPLYESASHSCNERHFTASI